MNLLRFSLAAGITLWTLTGAAALAQPTCASQTGQYPCTLGGTLLLLGPPTGNATSFVGGQGNSGSFIDDPQNPGLAAATTPSLTFGGAAIPFLISNLSLATVNGQATMNGVRGSFACGVTGAAVYALTLTTPQGILTLNCPRFTSIGTVGTVEGQINFLPTSSLSLVVNLSGRAPTVNDTVTLSAFSFQIPDQNFIGSMPHIAAEENWTTTFTLVNKGAAAAQSQLSLFGDALDPTGNGPLTLPLDFPQQPPPSGPLLASSFSGTVAANASLVIDTGGPQTPPVLVGSAHLAATGAVDGFAIFHQVVTAQEAVVPMETRYASSYLLAFDNTAGVVLGVAVTNVSAQAAKIPVVIRDDTGTPIGPPGATISLAGNGHTSFVLSTQYPATVNIRGTIEFDTPAGGQISVLGIRTTPLGTSNTLTTIPALANVGAGGGSIAHLATGNGWQTTFVLVNTGIAPAQTTLSFFADDGTQLRLPLSFPQTGANSTASSVGQVLAPGATLIVESAAPLSNPAPTTGSAQVATNGNVGGFVIFRYNPNGQEAVVPLESRNAASYLLAFDNTAGTATGIAINSVSTQTVNIPVVVRDDAGMQIATDTLNLAANGHLAFTLAVDKYLAAAGLRGTIEFGTPAGAQIGALGIRIPLAHTFTTLPPLAK
jgi:hypothetical protein